MKADVQAPADTRMMTIVHGALRRDLARADDALGDPAIGDERRTAVIAHARWMMDFLEAHHHAEDAGVYALVRRRKPQAAELLDRMEADHRATAEAIARVRAAADQRDALALRGALTELCAVLLPHLDREEREAMPVVAATISAAEWNELEQLHNIEPKSLRQLAHEGHWILDGLGPEDRAVVMAVVPAIPRALILRGWARWYRRLRARTWGITPPPRRVQRTGHVAVTVDARPDDVLAVVRDVTRTGEWSHECRGAEWLGDVHHAVPGARFRGRNRQGASRWSRICEIVDSAPDSLTWRTVGTPLFPDVTEWTISARPHADGAEIDQSFRVLKGSALLSAFYAIVVPAHRDRNAALRADLQRLGQVAAGTPVTR